MYVLTKILHTILPNTYIYKETTSVKILNKIYNDSFELVVLFCVPVYLNME